jgi:hypothetical protein
MEMRRGVHRLMDVMRRGGLIERRYGAGRTGRGVRFGER